MSAGHMEAEILGSEEHPMLEATYNPLLVFLSLLVAILASYVALDMAGRINASQGRTARWWLVGGAGAMGVGIWSMHFIGMLAFRLPIPLGYDVRITFASLLIAVVSSAFALWLGCQKELPWSRLLGGAVLMGLGISGMHYTGMEAMQMAPGIVYDPALLVLSVLIAIACSGVALWLEYYLRRHFSGVWLLRACAAVVMGLAIAVMHYTGMKAAQFPTGSVCIAAEGTQIGWLALVIATFTFAVLAIALTVSILDARLEERTSALMELALHDTLTKLPNRILLSDRIEQAVRHADRELSSFALMFIDLDGFKGVNDTYGHHVGDKLLIEVARRIQMHLRTQDTVARVGGDEFVLVAEVSGPADAATIAGKLVQALRQPFWMTGQALRISASVGIALYPGEGQDQHDLLSNADAAMYHAKSMGRDNYYFFAAKVNCAMRERA
jgi:diguanylate cyclase (GGDEF)-like protein